VTYPILLILGLLCAFAPMAIDLYLPSFPALAGAFDVSVEQVQTSLAAYFVGLAIGQLIYGPLADRFGRRRPLIVGTCIFAFASLLCAFSPSLHWLIAARFLQALGGCAGMVIYRAVIRDLCNTLESARVFSQLMLVMGVAPMLAPLLGGWLLVAFGWRAVFMVLFAFGLLALLVIWRGLPETSAPVRHSPRDMLRAYLSVFRDPALVGYGLAGGLGIAGMFAYIAGSPFVFIELYGVAPANYGWLFGINAAGFILMAQLNALLLHRHGPAYWLRRASWLYVVAAGGLLAMAIVGPEQLWPLFLPLFVAITSQACILPNATACAMAGQGEKAGIASATLGFLQFGVAAASASLVTLFHDGSARPMAAVIFGCALASLLLTWMTASRVAPSDLEF